jgi:hemerythrin-like domain-containing protein
MKRAPELRDLSDHHHRGLVQARRLKRAATGDEANMPEETAEAFLEFWQEGTTTHFREEEEVLLPVLARYREDLLGREPVVEMLLQHARIRGLVMGLSDEVKGGSVRLETLGSIGELLESHIRLEEREVFPTIEEALPEEALREVADRLEAKKTQPQSEPWVPAQGLSYDPLPGPGDSEGGGYDWPSRSSPR